MKQVMLLAIVLFGISAPAPDAHDIAEMTSGFIVPEQQFNLEAADQAGSRSEEKTSTNSETNLSRPSDSAESLEQPVKLKG